MDEKQGMTADFETTHAATLEMLRDAAPALANWLEVYNAVRYRGILPRDGSAAYVRVIAEAVPKLLQRVEAYPRSRTQQLAGWARDDRKAQAFINRKKQRLAALEKQRADEEQNVRVWAERHLREAAARQAAEESERLEHLAEPPLTGWE